MFDRSGYFSIMYFGIKVGGVLWDVRCGVRIFIELFLDILWRGDVECPVVVIKMYRDATIAFYFPINFSCVMLL